MLSQFFILSSHGDMLIFRDYKGNIVRGTAEIFYRRIKNYKMMVAPPIFNVEGTHFLHIVKSGLYFVCTTTSNVPPVFVLELLVRIASVCKDFCGALDEESIRSNFSLIYEVLDEILDFGYPQSTSVEGLKPYIFNEAKESKDPALGLIPAGAARVFGAEKRSVPGSAANQSVISTRNQRVSNKNEIFVDVLETLTVLIGANNSLIQIAIDGRIRVKNFLSESSLVRITLNDNIYTGIKGSVSTLLDNVTYHEVINQEEFEESGTLLFTPPDGECDIIKYQRSDGIDLPFLIHPFIEDVDQKEIEVDIKLECCVPNTFHATNVSLTFAVPKATVSVSHPVNSGLFTYEYNASSKTVLWNIRKMQGKTSLHAKFKLTVSTKTHYTTKEIGPIHLEFEFPMYVCSKLKVTSLKVSEAANSVHTPMRWIRYITHTDSYVKRI